MVSERHNQAYKESMKWFAQMNSSSAMRSFAPAEVISWGSLLPPGESNFEPLYLVHESAGPLFTQEECDAVIAESEAVSEAMGGWTSKRHFNHPTIDIPLQELPQSRAWFNEVSLRTLYPFLGSCFEGALPNPRALRVADAFVVKYNASGGQTFLSPHRDGSVLSFNIALNERTDYEGGGTWFEGLGKSLAIDRGHMLCHASGLLHGGHPISSGVRYILVGFVIVEGYQNWAMRFMKQVWDR